MEGWSDKPRDECGVAAVIGHNDAAAITLRMLGALQHRGQDSWGILAHGDEIVLYKSMGMVADYPSSTLFGSRAIGHVRYSLTGKSVLSNAHPHVIEPGKETDGIKLSPNANSVLMEYPKKFIGICHNGNFNSGLELLLKGDVSDTRQFLEMVRRANGALEQRIASAIQEIEAEYYMTYPVQSAYALVAMDNEKAVALRDPRGFRPLSIGRLGNAYLVASETVAIEAVNGRVLRDVGRGELVVFENGKMHSQYLLHGREPMGAQCIFEHIYLADPKSFVFGKKVEDFRREAGKLLARKYPVGADMVVAIPDSGNLFAEGYAGQLQIPFDRLALYENQEWQQGRVFITPGDSYGISRRKLASDKIMVNKRLVEGKVIVLVDDSVVGGVNARVAIDKLFKASAKEVHLRVGSPPYIYPCYWGVATSDPRRFIARYDGRGEKPLQEIGKELNATSLAYLDIEDILSLAPTPNDMCVRCFRRE